MATLVSNGVTSGEYVTARAWVSINGSASPTIIADYNVNSVTYSAAPGTYPNQPAYIINLSTAVPSGYSVVTSGTVAAGGGYPSEYIHVASTTQFRWHIGQNGGSYSHNSYASAIIYR